MKTLSAIDFVVVGLYFAALIAIGIITSRRQTSEEMYFLGGRRTPWLLAGISVIASLLSTVTFVSLPGEMVRYGVGLFYSVLSLVIVVPVVNGIIIPALKRLPVTSVYDCFERRFGLSTRLMTAGVFVLMRLIWIGLIIYMAAFAIAEMTNANATLLSDVSATNEAAKMALAREQANWLATMIIVVGLITTFYATLGGIKAVILADCLQFTLLVGGALYVPLRVAYRTGVGPAAWWHVFAQTGRQSVPLFSLDPNVRISIVMIIVMALVWHICTHGADQVAAQRYLSTPTLASARRSVWVFAISNFIVIVLLMINGLALFYFNFVEMGRPLPEYLDYTLKGPADRFMPHFIANQLPAGLAGLMVAALLAAAMSAMSAGINSISTVVSTDFLDRLAKPEREKAKVIRAKIIAALTGIIGIGMALLVQQLAMQKAGWNLIEIIERVNHIFVAPLGALFFIGILSRRVGTLAGLIGFCLGTLTSVLLAFSEEIFLPIHFSDNYVLEKISFVWIMPASFLMTVVGAYVAALFLPPPSPEQAHALDISRT